MQCFCGAAGQPVSGGSGVVAGSMKRRNSQPPPPCCLGWGKEASERVTEFMDSTVDRQWFRGCWLTKLNMQPLSARIAAVRAWGMREIVVEDNQSKFWW
jgi:hypothetical protein